MTVDVAEPAVWGVGRVATAGETRSWPVSPADIADETASSIAHLISLGVGNGDFIVITSLLSQVPHVYPLEEAAGEVGAVYCSTDATPFDAFRAAVMIRQLRARAAIGISGDTVDGLAEGGRQLTDVFGSLDAVATVDERAHAALSAAGLEPRRWLKVGPTNAFECRERDGAHIDGERWLVEQGDGSILVTNLVPRLTDADRLDTGIAGEIVTDPCPCGRPGPRIRIGG
jgi:hypothetical protein